MKICHFSLPSPLGEQNRLGILVGPLEKGQGRVLDVNLFWAYRFRQQGFYNWQERADHYAPPSLSAILQLKSAPVDFFLETLHRCEKNDSSIFTIKDAQLNAPLDRITTYRDFYAHEKHVAKGFELRKEPIPPSWYELPVYYKGATHGFIGHEDEILWPSYTKILDYELELAAVIGKDGHNITEKDAFHHLFGLTILNDVSARDIQKKEMALRLGPAKAKDFCSVIGPVITTMDEFEGKEPDLTMTATINGQEWSRGQSGHAHYSFCQMIAHVCRDEWVLAGDLLGSGTVGTGCGLELSRWIQPGDVIDLEVENIGHLRNKVGKPKESDHGKL